MEKANLVITVETKIESSGHPGEYEQPVINIRDSLIKLGWTPPRESDDEWVKELENNFKYKNHNKGDLIQFSGNTETLNYQSSSSGIYLNSVFTINQLESLVKHMKKYGR